MCLPRLLSTMVFLGLINFRIFFAFPGIRECLFLVGRLTFPSLIYSRRNSLTAINLARIFFLARPSLSRCLPSDNSTSIKPFIFLRLIFSHLFSRKLIENSRIEFVNCVILLAVVSSPSQWPFTSRFLSSMARS